MDCKYIYSNTSPFYKNLDAAPLYEINLKTGEIICYGPPPKAPKPRIRKTRKQESGRLVE